jgi:hypothetical protein
MEGEADEYVYSVLMSDTEAGQLFAWHWHPGAHRPDCHIHVGARQGESRALYRLHIPSWRVAFEEVLRFLLEEFDVEPARDDWREISSPCSTGVRICAPTPHTIPCWLPWRLRRT